MIHSTSRAVTVQVLPDLQTLWVRVVPVSTSPLMLESGKYHLRSNLQWEFITEGERCYLVGSPVTQVVNHSTLGSITNTARRPGLDHASQFGRDNTGLTSSMATGPADDVPTDHPEHSVPMSTADSNSEQGTRRAKSPAPLEVLFVPNVDFGC